MIGVHTTVRPSDWFIAAVCLIVNHFCLSHAQALEFAWESSLSADVAGYYLYYGDVNGTITNRIVLGNTTSTSFTEMRAGVIYFFYITAYDQLAQESEPSNTITYSGGAGVNSAPMLAAIPNQMVNEGTTLTLTASAADSDIPANVLTYSLDPGAPAGMSINSSTGVLTWTPTESQGPNTITITVRVTDNGMPPLSDTKSFIVVVTEVNKAPLLVAIDNQEVKQGRTLSLTVAATDPDGPANAIVYTLVNGPTGASLNATNGAFTWTPPKSQAPSTNSVTVCATDNGSPPLSDTKTFSIVVTESNAPPLLGALADQAAVQGSTLSFMAEATDIDLPMQTLTYSLDPGAPAGAAINPMTGVFTWTPATNQAPSTNTLTIRVADNGWPPLSDTRTVTIVVNKPSGLRLLGLTSVSEGYVSLAWRGEAGRSYRVQWKANISDSTWSDLAEVTGYDALGYFVHAVGLAPQGFYRVQLIQ